MANQYIHPIIKLRTQALGAFSYDLSKASGRSKHLIYVEPSAVPTAGALAITAFAPGITAGRPITGTIDMTPTAGVVPQIVEGIFGSFTITPTGFDAGKTFNVAIISYD